MIHMSENKSYNDKVYDACNYIIDHMESFKDYTIYEDVKDRKRRYNRGEIGLYLHNRFFSQFKFLIGEGDNKPSQTDPKGTEIVPRIDYQSLNTIRLAKMLAITDHIINEYRIKLNYQMFRINVDKTIPIMDYLIEQIISADEYNAFSQRRKYLREKGVENIPESKEYFKILEMSYFVKKEILYNEHKSEICSSVAGYYIYMLKVFGDTIAQNKDNHTEIIRLESCFRAMLYVDLCCKAILQYVMQGIIKNKKNKRKIESINKLNEAIFMSININLMERNEEEEDTKLDKRPEDNLFRFYFYFWARDWLLQDTKNLKKFMNIQDKNEKDVTRTSLITFYKDGKKKSWKDIQNIFEEGYDDNEKKELKTFKRNVAKCLCLIKRLNMTVKEDSIPYSPIRLKSLYREIYIEKSKYDERGKDVKSIVNEFLKSGSIQNAEYYYIQEIINKGFCTEYGVLEEWYAKNELQENLYYLACLCLVKLNPLVVIEAFHQVVECLVGVMREIENECCNYAPIPEEFYPDIGEFDLPMDCNNMTNEESQKIYLLLEKLFGISN